MRFKTTILKLGINPVIDPPGEALARVLKQSGKSKGPIPIRGLINGAEFVQTLIRYAGKWRVYVNGQMLRASGLAVGDAVEVEIEYDPRPRQAPMVAELKAALDGDAGARAAFEALTASRRTDILRYLSSLKTSSAVARNVEKVLKQLRGA